ncbi:MAG: YqgE/AlgH family protein [Candidatus Aureabacteria bacterium]|nr:YqgE/AlgH family protein [Candidatus Auribacterota bacterium]
MTDYDSVKGQFLIATPELQDPNFRGRVVFICDHNEQGAFGLIINHKASIKKFPKIRGLEGNEWIFNQDLYFGGPVHTDHILILYRGQNTITYDKWIADNIALVTSLSELYQLSGTELNSDNVRLYLGCAGWTENQLESEIESGVWKIVSSDTDMIFSNHPRYVWKENLMKLGGRYKIIAQMPDEEDILGSN